MSNSYFQFKQFRIEQEKCGMKVTTDGCLFGALIEINETDRVLDIRTGTSLIALMMTKHSSDADITGIEIDKDTYEQARLNCQSSTWSKNLKIHFTSL